MYKELERVKKELRVKEKQLSSMQKSMQICENELVALEEECKEKIVQVQHEVSTSMYCSYTAYVLICLITTSCQLSSRRRT